MMRYFLSSFAQGGYDDDPINCEVSYVDDADPKIQGTYPSQPLDGDKLGPTYDNADLCAALSTQLGVNVQQLKIAKPKPVEPIPANPV